MSARAFWSFSVTALMLAAGASRGLLGQTPATPASRPPAAAPGSGQTQASQGTGLIVGQVVDGRDGKAIPGATVTLTGGNPAPVQSFSFTNGSGGAPLQFQFAPNSPRRVSADGQGRFVFTDLPPGSFSVSATATGYQAGVQGQLRPGGLSRPIVLLPDQKMGGVTVPLWKFAVISGTVIDEGGDPAIGVTVRVITRVDSGGSVRFTPQQSARTDDRGMYRISGLTPGHYIVSVPSSTTTMPTQIIDAVQGPNAGQNATAITSQLNASGLYTYPNAMGTRVGDAFLQPGQNGNVSAYASDRGVFVQPSLYYPNANSVASATVIPLTTGDERSNVDFQLNPVRGLTVSGTFVGLDGPAPPLAVRLLPADLDQFDSDDSLEVATTVATPDGKFTFLGVPPGSYQLRALRVARPAPPPPPPPPPLGAARGAVAAPPAIAARPLLPTDPTLFAQQSVALTDSDLTGVSVALRTGPRLTGRVEFIGSAPRPANPQQITISLTPGSGRSVGGPLQAVVDPNGDFTSMSVPPGKYRINANAPGWTLRTAMVNGRDAAEATFDIDGGNVGGAVITFFDKPAQVSGTVHTAKGDPDPSATVYLFRPDYSTWPQTGGPGRRQRSTRAGTDGRFSFAGLTPGDYLMVAVGEASLSGADLMPIIEAAAPLATRVTVGEGAKQTQDLTTSQVNIR
jgi:hypothetical protein